MIGSSGCVAPPPQFTAAQTPSDVTRTRWRHLSQDVVASFRGGHLCSCQWPKVEVTQEVGQWTVIGRFCSPAGFVPVLSRCLWRKPSPPSGPWKASWRAARPAAPAASSRSKSWRGGWGRWRRRTRCCDRRCRSSIHPNIDQSVD